MTGRTGSTWTGSGTERLARLNAELERSELGALLSFDFANIRYMTATHIGTWAVDKLIRFALLPRGGKPVVWDFGSAARHHQLYNPWLDHTDGPATPEGAARTGARAGISTLRGAFHPDAGIAEDVAAKIAEVLHEHGLAGEPLGIDVAEMPVLAALAAAGITVTDGQQVFMEARRIKTRTRSRCCPRRAPWSTPPTTACTSSSGPACGRTSASAWSARSCTTWAASTSRA